jgi:hypothetical protein
LSKRRILSGPQYGDPPTPEQRAAAEKRRREREAYTRAKCDGMKFWRDCNNKRCRRHQRCSGDEQACWEVKWGAQPEIIKDQLRLAIKFMRDGMPPPEAFATARTELLRELEQEIERLEREAAGAAAEHAAGTQTAVAVSAASTPPPTDPPGPRVRLT